MILDTAERRQALENCASAGVFLAAVLLSPDAAVLAHERLGQTEVAHWPSDDNEDVRAGKALLVTALNEPASSDDIVADYRRLFIGPERILVCPYESVHVGDEGIVFDEVTFAVRHDYAAHGLSAPNPNREPDDHIGLEISFLAELALRALDALDDGLDAASLLVAGASFIDEHLGQFAPTVASLMAQHASTAYWQGIAHLLSGSLPAWRAAFAGIDLAN